LVHPKNKKKTHWRLPKIEGCIVKYKVLPLWPIYIGERRTTSAKACGIKVRYYWELFGEHVRNMGTLCFSPPRPQPKKQLAWKVECPLSKWKVNSGQSTLHKKQNLRKKNPLLPPPVRKKGMPLHSMTLLLIGWMEILFLKLAATTFGLD